jgi:hypothetical protein
MWTISHSRTTMLTDLDEMDRRHSVYEQGCSAARSMSWGMLVRRHSLTLGRPDPVMFMGRRTLIANITRGFWIWECGRCTPEAPLCMLAPRRLHPLAATTHLQAANGAVKEGLPCNEIRVGSPAATSPRICARQAESQIQAACVLSMFLRDAVLHLRADAGRRRR